MNLDDVLVFCAIVDAGSLSAAGRRVGIPPMAVSRSLGRLEKELGVRLLQRTTRSLSLTHEGELFVPLAQAMAEARTAATDAFSSEQMKLSGTLRVTAPNLIGRVIAVPAAAKLMADNPALNIDLVLSDSQLDLVARAVDVAIRVAPLQPSGLIATKLADNRLVLCAAPAYLAAFGVPIRLADLAHHTCLTLHAMEAWTFQHEDRLVAAPITSRFSANSVEAVRRACIEGAGIALVTYWDIAHDLEMGTLRELRIEDGAPHPLAIWAVLPSRKLVPPRVRRFLDEMRLRLSK
jgi:DNA-binding transcriptional LysR family regulator